MRINRKVGKIIIITSIFICMFGLSVSAEPIVDLNINGGNSPGEYVNDIKLLVFMTFISLLPSFIMMATCFTRIVVVFSFLKNALGAQQSIPNQVLIGLALFLTIFIMSPVYTEIDKTAIQPYIKEEITMTEAINKGSVPLRSFMLKQTRQKDLRLFVELSGTNMSSYSKTTIPLQIVIPAFITSELKTAFLIGFLIYLPFLIIDIVVSSVLMSMGMFMLPPAMVSLPFKLLLFVMVDGWFLIVKSLSLGFL